MKNFRSLQQEIERANTMFGKKSVNGFLRKWNKLSSILHSCEGNKLCFNFKYFYFRKFHATKIYSTEIENH